MLVCSENFALMKQNFQFLSQLTLTNGTMWASSPTNTKGVVALKSTLELIDLDAERTEHTRRRTLCTPSGVFCP